ncbi:L-threonine kinase [Anaerosolibacter carboniphilus]|uniref:L-threonine kinase n=1 Tax=Anaerosolibacter carboniphilus TaxID=1417629 RepID=A0A841KMH2_9FIRM|nr:propanediol utilization protein [Anaerosolibacter carboniphilus]MBB6214603.1 L-threonine kinase [Anaerosolibacter carboniphilus]
MRVKAKCPASCGELLQGMIGTNEKLISYPVDIFSQVVIEERKNPKRDMGRKKATEAMYRTLAYYGEAQEIGDSLMIEIQSNIPIAKGMASSTADIAATAAATAALIGKKIDSDALAKICVGIEPTDSTIYKELTLFDHLKGIRIETFDWSPAVDVLILESDHVLDTQVFRKSDYSKERMEVQPQVEEAFRIFKEGALKRELSLLGKAAIVSSLANQRILPKNRLEEIIEIAIQHGCLGVNVAHSGTVVGILMERDKVDAQQLKGALRNKNVFEHYNKAYCTKMIQGGVRIIEE